MRAHNIPYISDSKCSHSSTLSWSDIIQKSLKLTPLSGWASLMHGQTNEVWALYKSNPPRVSWDDLSRDRYIACPKLASPAGNTFAQGLLLT